MPVSSPHLVKAGRIHRSRTKRPPMLIPRMGALIRSYHGAVLLSRERRRSRVAAETRTRTRASMPLYTVYQRILLTVQHIPYNTIHAVPFHTARYHYVELSNIITVYCLEGGQTVVPDPTVLYPYVPCHNVM